MGRFPEGVDYSNWSSPMDQKPPTQNNRPHTQAEIEEMLTNAFNKARAEEQARVEFMNNYSAKLLEEYDPKDPKLIEFIIRLPHLENHELVLLKKFEYGEFTEDDYNYVAWLPVPESKAGDQNKPQTLAELIMERGFEKGMNQLIKIKSDLIS